MERAAEEEAADEGVAAAEGEADEEEDQGDVDAVGEERPAEVLGELCFFGIYVCMFLVGVVWANDGRMARRCEWVGWWRGGNAA